MEIRPTTRNPYLETLDEGVYPNTTARTTMDKEDAAYQNERNCLDSSGYDATQSQVTNQPMSTRFAFTSSKNKRQKSLQSTSKQRFETKRASPHSSLAPTAIADNFN